MPFTRPHVAAVTMQGVFRAAPLQPDEIVSLVAFLGMGGAVLGLALAGGIWRRRFRAVRRPLVDGDATGSYAIGFMLLSEFALGCFIVNLLVLGRARVTRTAGRAAQ